MHLHKELDPRDYFRQRLVRVPKVLRRFRNRPSFSGKRVLDIGSGYGALSVYAAEQGADSVIGVDLDRHKVEVARNILRNDYPKFNEHVRYECRDVEELDSEQFDLVVSMAVFEHVLDPLSTLQSINRRLSEKGTIHLGIGPLYRAPWGDHKRIKAPGYRLFPWAHLCFSEKWLVERRNRMGDVEIEKILDLGLNCLRFDDYVRAFQESGLGIREFRINVHETPGITPLLNGLRRLPGLKDLLTVNMYVTLSNIRAE